MSASRRPPTLITRVRRTLREETRLQRGQTVVVAVSGGPDSTALLHVLHHLASPLGIGLCACGVDHGLRPEAPAELDQVAALTQRLKLPFRRIRVRVPSAGNLQANARAARYEALEQCAQDLGAQWIATGHHARDRAETVLLRILGGAGPGGLAVLPACSPRRLRPLIRCSPQMIVEHLDRHSLTFSHDPSNRDARFRRVRVRHELIPLMEDISEGAVARLNDLADALSSGPVPTVLDPEGKPLPLRRAHIQELQRLTRLKRGGALVRLSGGWEVEIPRAGRTNKSSRASSPALPLVARRSRSRSAPAPAPAEPEPPGDS